MSRGKKILRFTLIAVGTVGFTWFVLPVFTGGIINIGNLIGCTFFGCIDLCGIFFNKVNAFVKKFCEKKRNKGLLISLIAFAVVCLTVAAGVSVKMVKESGDLPTGETTLVILGCQVNGEKPSLMLMQRMRRAYGYLSENPEINCVLSGGQGIDEDISEAECMFRYLTEWGIDPKRLFKEENSTSTRENLAFSAQIIEKEGLATPVTIVTHEFHMCRARIIAKKVGMETFALPTPTSLWLLPTFWVRDVCGVAAETVLASLASNSD